MTTILRNSTTDSSGKDVYIYVLTNEEETPVMYNKYFEIINKTTLPEKMRNWKEIGLEEFQKQENLQDMIMKVFK